MKPQDFFISARDFFAIIIPGALLLLLAGAAVPEFDLWSLLQERHRNTDNTGLNLLICFVCTYGLGTVLGGIGSRLDWFSDKATGILMAISGERETVRFGLRKMDKLRQTELLARELEVSLFPGIEKMETRSRPWSTRAFWWNYLRLNCPAALSELDRIEGQQKQFRSMIIGGCCMTAIYAVYSTPDNVNLSIIATFILVYSYWSYRNRFARRLFELAIVNAVPQDWFTENSTKFFSRSKSSDDQIRTRIPDAVGIAAKELGEG